ncbi:hypothetical protein ACFL34_01390 [Candidatus Sumerlaeota bacterium]
MMSTDSQNHDEADEVRAEHNAAPPPMDPSDPEATAEPLPEELARLIAQRPRPRLSDESTRLILAAARRQLEAQPRQVDAVGQDVEAATQPPARVISLEARRRWAWMSAAAAALLLTSLGVWFAGNRNAAPPTVVEGPTEAERTTEPPTPATAASLPADELDDLLRIDLALATTSLRVRRVSADLGIGNRSMAKVDQRLNRARNMAAVLRREAEMLAEPAPDIEPPPAPGPRSESQPDTDERATEAPKSQETILAVAKSGCHDSCFSLRADGPKGQQSRQPLVVAVVPRASGRPTDGSLCPGLGYFAPSALIGIRNKLEEDAVHRPADTKHRPLPWAGIMATLQAASFPLGK